MHRVVGDAAVGRVNTVGCPRVIDAPVPTEPITARRLLGRSDARAVQIRKLAEA